MRKVLITTVTLVFWVSYMQAQNAQIQFIHNAADVSINLVDIYTDGELVVDNLSFKTGTAFLDIPFTGNSTEITVTAADDVSLVYVEKQQELIDNERYYVVLDGVFDTDFYEDIEERVLHSYQGARVAATHPDSETADLEILTHNGALGFSHELDVQGTQILAYPLEFGTSLLFGDFSESSEESNYTSWASDSPISVDIADFNGIGGNVLSAFEYYTTLELGAPGFPDYSGQAVIMLLTGFENPDLFDNGEPFEAYLLSPEGGDFQPLLSLKEELEINFSMFPNPVDDIIHLQSPLPFSGYEIFDIQGKLLKQNLTVENKASTLNVNNLVSGVYFITVYFLNYNTSITKRIIKR